MIFKLLSIRMQNGMQAQLKSKTYREANNTGYKLSANGMFSLSSSESAKRVLSITVLFFLAAFIATTLATLHLHVAPDGRVYIHSHPVESKSAGDKHGHSRADYSFLNIVTNICHKLLTIAITLYTIQVIRWSLSSTGPEHIYSCDLDYDHSNRAPPCGLLFPA